ncbi:hypothetical protein [Pleionea mediterranea]|uniref:Uncharacterized protein n=1 Tax=Pleionea mediterranea TaxID=523701 RepID=A0A316FZ42_9GAMM|nr:hypothetical protein [Pleionea mediterranea]PWK53911.1 hypothetical protein C8D97_102301 [Pleionea mediterranea]
MSDSFSERLSQIDNRLQKLDEEKRLLVTERNEIMARQEIELAKHFNQLATPEAKVDLFISYFQS